MCEPVTAAIAAKPLVAAGLAISAIGTGTSIYSAFQNANNLQKQAKVAHRNAQNQTQYERQVQVAKHIGDTRAYNAQVDATDRQVFNISEAANRAYMSEQAKLQEARNAAAFKAQQNYIKSITSQGRVLASGATGQSIGLLAMDAERQAGFSTAAENASIRSAELASTIAMDTTQLQQQSAMNQAQSRIGATPQAPLFAPMPSGPSPLGLGIPAYNWG